jgi:hypothetical protein
MLKTETNTPEMQQRVESAAENALSLAHENLSAVFEHGQWWIVCRDCDRQWSVVDASGGDSVDGFGFEVVKEGDDYCEGEGGTPDDEEDQ